MVLLGIIFCCQKAIARSLGHDFRVFHPMEIVMPESQSHHNVLLARLREHMHAERYGRCAARNYPSDARRFFAEIRAAKERLGISDQVLWRER